MARLKEWEKFVDEEPLPSSQLSDASDEDSNDNGAVIQHLGSDFPDPVSGKNASVAGHSSMPDLVYQMIFATLSLTAQVHRPAVSTTVSRTSEDGSSFV